jgi:hypothetical protein
MDLYFEETTREKRSGWFPAGKVVRSKKEWLF